MLAHHFTRAGLDDAAIEWWGKAGDQALRRSAFKEATAHLGKAIEMADKMAQTALVNATQGGDRLRLQISYGNALISARGYGAQETTAAFARARELVAQAEDAADRFSAYYGLWVGPFTRGELAPMREVVQALLRDCEDEPRSPEAGIAHRLAGTTNWYAGDFEEALVTSIRLWRSSIRSGTVISHTVSAMMSALRKWPIWRWCGGHWERPIERTGWPRRW